MSATPSLLLNQTQLAAALGVGKGTVCDWTRSGLITPEIHEGMTIRYDLSSVRAQLRESAAKQRIIKLFPVQQP